MACSSNVNSTAARHARVALYRDTPSYAFYTVANGYSRTGRMTNGHCAKRLIARTTIAY